MRQYTGSVPDTLRAADWRDLALCATDAYRAVDFFPNPTDKPGNATAVAVCETCPVRLACLRDALRQEGGRKAVYRDGIRGGLTADQRYSLWRSAVRARAKARKQPKPPAPCGTPAAYQRHVKQSEPVCKTCAAENRKRVRAEAQAWRAEQARNAAPR
ncbi:WhiB family transcriptional regulator [Streptomyces sp. cmx-10-25]|uniref:WhiB family transcriptional regulator n=1 Tax=Streptomyces sp. cmx-10-25 TaxID=2790919 RepID=UPI00397F5C22